MTLVDKELPYDLLDTLFIGISTLLLPKGVFAIIIRAKLSYMYIICSLRQVKFSLDRKPLGFE